MTLKYGLGVIQGHSRSGSVFDTVRPVESSEVTKLINSIPPEIITVGFYSYFSDQEL